MAKQNLKEKTADGLMWGGINNISQQVLNAVFGIFLARLLTPADYGLVGMLTIFSLMAVSLQESGFIYALNQKKSVSHEDYNAVFWFNILCGSALYAILFFCAPLIATFFDKPVLLPLSRLYFLSFLISSFAITPRAYLFRNLQVKETALMTLCALLISGIAGITLAWNGFSYWGIAMQNLIYCFIISLMSWYYSAWRPTMHINLHPLRSMIGFSSKLLITNLFSHVNNNIFSIFFGKLYGEQMVGYYNQANKWTSIGSNSINGMLIGVTQPVFARLEDDKERKQRIFRKMMRFTAFVSFPAMLGLALIAPEFITITISAKWIESAKIMQMLCISGAFFPIMQLYANFLISQGKSNVYMYNTISLCLVLTAALFTLRPYGAKAMIAAYVCLNILWLPVWHARVKRLIGIKLLCSLKDILPFALASLLAMACGWALSLTSESIYVKILFKIAGAAVVYIGIMKLSGAVVLKESWEYFSAKLKKRKQGN